jgi:hypothetical protein
MQITENMLLQIIGATEAGGVPESLANYTVDVRPPITRT